MSILGQTGFLHEKKVQMKALLENIRKQTLSQGRIMSENDSLFSSCYIVEIQPYCYRVICPCWGSVTVRVCKQITSIRYRYMYVLNEGWQQNFRIFIFMMENTKIIVDQTWSYIKKKSFLF